MNILHGGVHHVHVVALKNTENGLHLLQETGEEILFTGTHNFHHTNRLTKAA